MARSQELHEEKTVYIAPVQQADPGERLALPQSRPIELQLAALDLGLLFVGALLVTGAANLIAPIPDLHENLLVALNMVLGFGFAFAFQYLDLSDGRYSLGKASLMAFSLWLLNAALFCFLLNHIPVVAMLISAGVWFTLALVSARAHYVLSAPFHTKKTDSPYYRLELGLKRAFDLGATLLGLVAISPIMLLVPLLLRMESKGSPIFIQNRVGKGEKIFPMYKFRSMVLNAQSMPLEKKAVLYKRDDDPRITRVGRLIRKLSIDELPQLWNVVRGEMSLVGPRPPLSDEYEMMNWYHRRKFEATPGLTGLWQVIGRVKNQRDFNAVAAYDVYYIENWSLMQDLEILLKTIPVVLLQKGAC